MKPWKQQIKQLHGLLDNMIPEPTFDEEWKPTEVFNALYPSCKFFSG